MLFSSLSRSRVSITYTSHTDDPPPLLPVGVSSSILLKALLPTVRNSAVHQVRTSLLVQHDRTRSIFPFMVNAAIGHSRSTTLNHGDHSHSRPIWSGVLSSSGQGNDGTNRTHRTHRKCDDHTHCTKKDKRRETETRGCLRVCTSKRS